MKRIYIFITCCFAGIIGTVVSMVFGLHWSCMIGTIIFVVAIALSLDVYYKERRGKDELYYTQFTSTERILTEFMRKFGIDRLRAEKLYHAGFQDVNDFKDKTVEDLMQIDDINPTLAKKIVQKMQNS